MFKYLASAGIIAGNIFAANGISICSEIAAKKLIKDGKSKKSRKRAKLLRLILSRGVTVSTTATLATVSSKPLMQLWGCDNKEVACNDNVETEEEQSNNEETSSENDDVEITNF